MPLFGGRKPTLSVTVEPDRIWPSQQVQVRVEVGGEVDDKVRGVAAGLRCVNRYAYEDRDSDGDTHTRHSTQTVHEEALPLGSGGPPPVGQHAVTLTLPANAPPSASGTVEWQAWARVDRPGRDVNEEAPLGVLAWSPLSAQDAQTPLQTSADCAVGFEGLSSRSVRPGEQLTGTLVVTPSDDVKATEVRVELRATKTSHSRGRVEEKLQDAGVPLAAAIPLAAGQTQRWPFAIHVPPDAVPSLRTELTTIRWQLVGVVARRMRPDHRPGRRPGPSRLGTCAGGTSASAPRPSGACSDVPGARPIGPAPRSTHRRGARAASALGPCTRRPRRGRGTTRRTSGTAGRGSGR